MDVLTTEQRKRNMQNIHNKNTSIELLLRKALWHKGVRFRVNCKGIVGKPDIVIKKYKLVVFCDGDFWHGKDNREVGTNSKFWSEKIKRNKERDLEQTIALRDDGWIVLRFWGSDIKEDINTVTDIIIKEIETIKQRKIRL